MLDVVYMLGLGREKIRGKTNVQEISNRTHGPRIPKPKYLVARSQLTERGPLGFGPIRIFGGKTY